MIVLFDEQTDWTNLSAVYASLDDEERRIRSMNVAYLKGMLDDENRFLNLGQSLGGIDIPSSRAKILVDGIEQGLVGNRRKPDYLNPDVSVGVAIPSRTSTSA